MDKVSEQEFSAQKPRPSQHFDGSSILAPHPLWLSVSEAAKLGGVQQKTIRRALKVESELKFKILKNRYQIEFGSLLLFLSSNKKLQNKFSENGLGQYLVTWKTKR